MNLQLKDNLFPTNRTSIFFLVVLFSFNFMYAHAFQPAIFSANINSSVGQCSLRIRSQSRPIKRYFTINEISNSNLEPQKATIPFDGSENRFDRWRFLQDFLDGEYPSSDTVDMILYRVLDGALKYPRPSEGRESKDTVEIKMDVRAKIKNILTQHSIDGRVMAVASISKIDDDFEAPENNMFEILKKLESVIPD